MTRATCETVRNRLVEYSDGDLDTATDRVISDHLEICAACRDELSHLRKSLDYAREIWRHSAEDAPAIDVRSLPPRHDLRKTVATAAVLSAVVAGVWLLGKSPLWKTRDADRHEVVKQIPHPAAAESERGKMSDLASLIAREAQSARLAASRQMLAAQPSLADYSREADTYLATAYKNSSAGAQARQRLGLPASSNTGALP